MAQQKEPLNANSRMTCKRHGEHLPSFICRHLQHGTGLGFNQPEDRPDADWPFEQAWCDDCQMVLEDEGEWNDTSEAYAGVMAICEGCFFEIKSRNMKH